MKKITGLFTIWACALFTLCHAISAPLDEAEQALQARDFEAAVTHLEKAKAGDYPSYLKAVALYRRACALGNAQGCDKLRAAQEVAVLDVP